MQLGLHPPYHEVRRTRVRPLHGAGVHRRIFGHCFPSLADMLPPFPMCAALPRSEYYGGSVPFAPSAGVGPIPSRFVWPTRRMWNSHEWFPRSLLSVRQVRHPALPLRHLHGYAVVLHRGLPTRKVEFQPRVPHPLNRTGAHRQPAHIHRVGAGPMSRGVTQPISCVYLPVSLTAPGPSGSAGPSRLCRGCSHPPRRPPDQAASSFTPSLRRRRSGRSLTSTRNHSAFVAHPRAWDHLEGFSVTVMGPPGCQ
jgi:hypothetical protein